MNGCRVNGTALPVDVNADELAGVRDLLLIETYGEPWWWGVGAPAQFARIDASRMYTFFIRETA